MTLEHHPAAAERPDEGRLTEAPTLEALGAIERPQPRERFYNYLQTLYNLRRAAIRMGATEAMLRGEKSPAKEISPETKQLYANLKAVILSVWEPYQVKLLADEQTRKQAELYEDEAAAYKQYDIQAEGLPTSDAMRCFEDVGRTEHFLETIKNTITEDDVVLEAGAGTGVLAIAAALAGAKEVHALEINPTSVELANLILDECTKSVDRQGRPRTPILTMEQRKRITIEPGDATADVPKMKHQPTALISENIYTGNFYEHQMRINRWLRRFLAPNAKIIPRGLLSGVQLTWLSDEVRDRDKVKAANDFVSNDQQLDETNSQQLSDPKLFDHINYADDEPLGMQNRIVISTPRAGTIHGLTLFSLVQLSEQFGDVIGRHETTFLNNDIVLLLKDPIEVQAGDQIDIFISFQAGDAPEQAVIVVRCLREGAPVQETITKKNIHRFDPTAYLDEYYPEQFDVERDVAALQLVRQELADHRRRVNVASVAEQTGLQTTEIENVALANFQLEVVKRLLAAFPDGHCTQLDVGGGPTIQQHTLMALVASEITHSDYLPVNQEAVQQWVDGLSPRDWSNYVRFSQRIVQDDTELLDQLNRQLASGSPEERRRAQSILDDVVSADGIERFVERTRTAMKRVIFGDVTQPGLALAEEAQGQSDVVTASFVIESAISDQETKASAREKWETYMRHTMDQVKPGGFLSLSAIRNAVWFRTERQIFGSDKVTEDDIAGFLVQHGFTIELQQVIDGSDKERVGYDGMVCVLARKQSAEASHG